MIYSNLFFWDQDLWPVPRGCEIDFKKLNNVGIFFDSPIEAAKQINKIWDNVYGWWNNQSLQDVRNEFCLKYSYVHPNNMRNFGNQLK